MKTYNIAVVGVGKIARDQHLPVIAKSPRFNLVAVVSGSGVKVKGVPSFATQKDLFSSGTKLDAIANCVPPSARPDMILEALEAGINVLMEKPPAATMSAFNAILSRRKAARRVLYQTWHSRYNRAVEVAQAHLVREGVASVQIDWRESVRKWHPGQDWVWEPAGFGVCDPGINAMSIFTAIMPFEVYVRSAVLSVPENRQTPVDARIKFGGGGDAPMSARFNWLEESGEIWTIAITTAKGDKLSLEKGGTILRINGEIMVEEPSLEYEKIYKNFVNLLDQNRSETDGRPLQLIADAFLVARRVKAAPFEW